MWRNVCQRDLDETRSLRLLTDGSSFTGLVLHGGQEVSRLYHADRELLWGRLLDEASRHSTGEFGWEAARATFRRRMPGGFGDPYHVGLTRDVTLKAKAKLEAVAPLRRAVEGQGIGASVLPAFTATDLLSREELMAVGLLLTGESADAFVRAAAQFTVDPGVATLETLAAILTEEGGATWSLATYLPFLWAPDFHMFLKPTLVQDFAFRVGHYCADAYEPSLTPPVYNAVLDLVVEAREALALEDPADNIDILSFMGTVCEEEPTQREAAE
ncbi:hypothetical protein [Acuticoccus kandeliae]|uniref:hypothetical protein n=1 Tax=Acuticoccus kandeliae TaxID=2073160 RepID=UPI000D3E3C4B|nr:hypothetical protein [Acuticoccus kandeliae]